MDRKKIEKIVSNTLKQDPDRDYIESISLFGSFVRGEATKTSDIDLFFEMRKTPSLFRILAIQQRLEKKLGRRVDLVSRGSLDTHVKERVLAEAVKIYDR
ncbi:MAG: nucleotidyltransferase domain-containing protein [Patescibacteria group bacterium]